MKQETQQDSEFLQCKAILDSVKVKGSHNSGILFHQNQNQLFHRETCFVRDTPNNQKHIMLFQGKGSSISSTFGALLAYEVFHGMVIKGFALEHIVREIGHKLNRFFPMELSFELLYFVFNEEDETLMIWNGTSHPIYMFDKTNQTLVKKTGAAKAINHETFKKEKLDLFCLPCAKSFLIYYENQQNGKVLEFEKLFRKCQLKDFSKEGGLASPLENTSLVLEPKNFNFYKPIETEETVDELNPLVLDVTFRLETDALKSWDPLPAIMHVLMEPKGLRAYRTEVFTLLTELYTNALEHGILELDSDIKKSADGIMMYYEEKHKRLQQLKSGCIEIQVKVHIHQNRGILQLNIEDSGKGFLMQNTGNNPFSGRGLSLIHALCQNVEYFKQGAKVQAFFVWQE